ncbi:hypothetical protein CY34DRAFT_371011 [Suillus luteus UH-Slu-Lm8-n1]|uniref:Uncharacterized protein n=1 Tax=Suillus luteus UH-Slu-Lm8-n1 TaxID=930992 RepID=A0A0D0AKY5_9AGAM|nr:hypothetical protein CY34DRAFT_371011 [Suillus luteus UH-Slu-Lm8-n1]
MINPQALTKMVINATHGNVEANATVALSVFKNDHMNTLILTLLLITMPCMPKRAAPKVVPSLGSTSTDVPPILCPECVARFKRKRRSSYVESDDGNALDDEADDDKVEEEDNSQSSATGIQVVSNQPRLFIKIRNPKRQTDTTKVDNSNAGDELEKELEKEDNSQSSATGAQAVSNEPRLFIKIRNPKRQTGTTKVDNSNAGDELEKELEKEDNSQSSATGAQAVSNEPRLFIKIRNPKRQTDTTKVDNSRDIKSHKKKEDDDSYEDSSSESHDESDDEYLPPRKRQRTRLQATSKFSSSRVRSSTSVSAAKTKKRV